RSTCSPAPSLSARPARAAASPSADMSADSLRASSSRSSSGGPPPAVGRARCARPAGSAWDNPAMASEDPSDRNGLVEMVVESVRVHMLSSRHVVILKESEHDRYLPIWIGP